ncbi:alpha-amylase [Rhizoctonia solani AG-1 IB]|uniref:ATP-dependent DNA helicase n=1 Tax=Thanatephorus cucumeris (strain AG1-IB / isolate 7/3/14) TaxID=1108050 RepID=A0A0B7FYW5_THACB|nr:alpha-amylase [Rhizoctonia solani AG-1 IB]
MLYRLVSWAVAATAVVAAPANVHSRAPSGSKSVIIQMFEWSWDSIAAECTNFIGPAGYGFVQVSPPAEHIAGSQWWTDYQPVSYTLTSKRGNRSQFQNMISKCKSAGVGVIADTIFNHMAGIEGGTGVAGSSFTHYNYPGIYQTQDFHHCGLQPGDDIVNYNNRAEVQTCELVNLSDLATETEYVRGKLAAYANDLLSLGVVGLRLDAAKHIASGDIANILGRLTSRPYITQEVIFGSGEPILPSEYTGNGDVQEFRYTSTIQNAFQSGGISSLNGLENRGWIASGGANVFVANHDTERNGASLTYKSGSIYTLAHVFMLAYPYGTPTVLSSYTFSNNDAGSPSNGAGSCSGSGGANGWQCQHRWSAVAGMVKWRNGVTGSVNNWVSGTNQQIAFGRGSSGFVVINNADSAWTRTFTTSLAANSYCDVVSGDVSGGKCTGASYTVSGGSFTAMVPAKSAIALFTGAIGTGSGNGGGGGGGGGSVTVNFRVNAETTFGDNIFLVGSLSQLGTWAPASSIAMSSASYPTWTVSVSIPAGTAFSYKYIRKTASGSVVWESDPNRSATAPSSGNRIVKDKSNVFFTGSAGTGKSVLLREVIQRLRETVKDPSRIQITASTGVAALNIGGTTLHSFAGIGVAKLPIRDLLARIKASRATHHRWLTTEILVIDEISMVSAQMLDLIDTLAREIRQNTKPFGGIQLVVSGDFFQLPPVSDEPDIDIGLESSSWFAFQADCWERSFPQAYKLTQVFRQTETEFVQLLNELRFGITTTSSINILKGLNRAIKCNDGILPTEIYPHRSNAQWANSYHLAKLDTEEWAHCSVDKYGKDRHGYPVRVSEAEVMLEKRAPKVLALQVGAQVMCSKNIPDAGLVNGSIGRVVDFITPEKALNEGYPIAGAAVTISDDGKPHRPSIKGRFRLRTWPLVNYVNSGSILMPPVDFALDNGVGGTRACRQQVPLILAWALTVRLIVCARTNDR